MNKTHLTPRKEFKQAASHSSASQLTVIMKKTAVTIVLLASCLAFGACSSYPTWVPEWAQVGAE
jgi:hypothetical protein